MQLDKSSYTLPNEKNAILEPLIEQYAEKVVYPAKKVFLVPGEFLRGVYYIAHGRTRHYMIGLDGAEKILYALSDGWFYGEATLTLQEPTGLFSRTEEETTIYIIPYLDYERLVDTNKVFRTAVMKNFSKKTMILRHEIENLTFNSCKERLKRLFCATADPSLLIEDKWYNLKVHYTQQEISAIIGGARITTSKLLKELCDEDFIRILNRNTQINAVEYKQRIEMQ